MELLNKETSVVYWWKCSLNIFVLFLCKFLERGGGGGSWICLMDLLWQRLGCHCLFYAVFLAVSESPPSTLSCKLLACTGRVTNMQRKLSMLSSLLNSDSAWHVLLIVFFLSCAVIFLSFQYFFRQPMFVVQCKYVITNSIFPNFFSLSFFFFSFFL